MLRRAVVTLSCLSLVAVTFYTGIFFGNIQGVFYADALSAHNLTSNLRTVERGEYYEGEVYDSLNQSLSLGFIRYGSNLDKWLFVYEFPTPFSLSRSAKSLMGGAVRYRNDNPHIDRSPKLSEEDMVQIREDVLSHPDREQFEKVGELESYHYRKTIEHVASEAGT